MPRRKRHPESRDSAAQVTRAAADVAARLGDVAAVIEDAGRAELATVAAAAVAHEVRNLLTPVRARLEMALLGLGDAALVERSVREALKGIERVGRATEAVLSVIGGRAEIGDGADAEEAAEAAAGWVESAGFSVERRVSAGTRVRMSQVSLEQVLLNLMMNARAALGGKGIIVVRINVETSNRAVIEVEDHGTGMNVRDVFGIQPADSRIEGGSESGRRGGVGLIVCRHLVEAVGGTMTVRSQVGVGTVVRIELEGMQGNASKAA